MTTNLTPWQAAADVLAVSRPAHEFIEAFEKAALRLTFTSPDDGCRFFTEVRESESKMGPAIIVTDMAEYPSRARQSAVVVSAVVHADHHTDREVVIRTHLEDQHTAYEGEQIVFEEHHREIRAVLLEVVYAVEPSADHRRGPSPIQPDATPSAEASERPTRRPRPQRILAAPRAPRFDPRQALGLGLQSIGVAVLLIAIVAGSLYPILVGLSVAGVLGYIGNRIGGL